MDGWMDGREHGYGVDHVYFGGKHRDDVTADGHIVEIVRALCLSQTSLTF